MAKSIKNTIMKRVFTLIFSILILISSADAQCDLATSGLTVMNLSNTVNISSICIGQKAIFKFSVLNFGTDPNCVIPVNSARAIFSFPSAYNYSGAASFTSGYFTWTYNGTNRTLVGLNTTALPQYEGDSVLVLVIGVAAATQTSVLNLSQLLGISDNTANNYSSADLTIGTAPVASISYPSSSYCPVGTATVTRNGQTGGTYISTTGLSLNATTGAINLAASTAGVYVVKYVFSNTTCTDTTSTTVTIKAKSTSNTAVSVCSTQTPYNWNGSNYSTSGNYSWSGTNAAGCDSLAILNLTVTQPTNTSQTVSACNSYLWNGNTYTQSGTYTFSRNNNGCAAVDTLRLTINRGTYNATTASACNSYIWNGTSYTQTGVYIYAYTNNSGCPSADTLRLTINRGTYNSTTTSACNSYVWNGTTYTQTGVYIYTYTNNSGCPSADTLRLTINKGVFKTYTQTACNSYVWNGTTYTQSGTYTFNYTTSNGCPSVDTLRLTINRSTYNSTTQTACNSYVWNSTSYSQSDIYTYSYTNTSGCASVDTLRLTIKVSTSSTSSVTVCSTQLPYVWNGTSYTSAGTYFKTIPNSSGCDSNMTLILTVTNTAVTAPASISQTLVVNVCGGKIYRYTATAVTGASGYQWLLPTSVGGISGVTVDSGDANSSRIIKVIYLSNNAALTTDSIFVRAFTSCSYSAYKSLKLTNTLLGPPAAPATITATAVQTNVCGAKIYRYTAPALPVATTTAVAATGYLWSFTGTLGANAVIDSGTATSQIIRVSFSNNAASATGDSVRVLYTSSCGNSSNKSLKLTNTLLTAPAAPSAITITAVQTNICGAKIYRYAAPALPAATTTAVAATGYLWSFTGTLGANAVIDSGTASSATIRVKFTSNLAATAGDSVRVLYTSSCGNTLNKSSILTNTALSTPVAPSTITITAIQTTVCGARLYRYAASALPSNASGYLWSFTGTLGTNAVLDSGTVNSQVIRLRFTSNAAAAAGDSVYVLYTSTCGNSPNKSAKLTNTLLSAPVAPSSITITAIQTNVCGAKIYRYAAPALVTNASGYLWSFTGTLGTNATIDSGTVNSQVIRVKYTNNAAAVAGDSVYVLYTSSCGNSPNKSARLTNTLLTSPTAPASITITAIQTNVCGTKLYRYAAPALPAATTTAVAATGYLWSFTGSLGANAVIDSGTATSQIIRVKFTNNIAATTGDSVLVLYTSSCGNSANKSSKLTNTVIGVPTAPTSITIAQVSDTCSRRIYRYTAPVLSTGSTTLAPATGYLWSLPTGTVGSTGVLDSGSLSGRVIRIRYSSNAAAAAGDSIRVLFTSSCGNSNIKAQKLTNIAKLGCPNTAKNIEHSTRNDKAISLQIFPNPTVNSGKLIFYSSSNEPVTLMVRNTTGKLINKTFIKPNTTIDYGTQLTKGIYIIEAIQNKEKQIMKLVKL